MMIGEPEKAMMIGKPGKAMMIGEPEKAMIGAVIIQAVKDARHIVKLAQGGSGSLTGLAQRLDALAWLLGPALPSAVAWLDLPDDFVPRARAAILSLDSTQERF